MNHKMSNRRKGYILTRKLLMWFSVGITAALVLFLVGYILVKGVWHITWELLSTKPSYLSGKIGILPDILNTLYIIIAALLVVLPLGVGAAIYLTEYAKNKKLVGVIEYASETLSGIPSIIYGLVGMLFFCQFLNIKTSLLAGALTLVIMNLPTVMRTTQESLKTVPQSYREGAFGLGAALLFTAGFAHVLNGFFNGLGSSGCTLTVALYVYAKEQGEFEVAFAIAAILMILTLIINFVAVLVSRYFKKRRSL